MMDRPSEAALIDKARGGDRAAFERLTAEAMPRVTGIVRRMVGHREDSDDIMQEALIKAWSAFADFRGEAKFSTWLTTIASRLAVDHLRRSKRWRTEAQIAYANLCASSPELGGEVAEAYAAPDFSYEVREHIAYCFTCVGRSLPADEQAALVLTDVAEMANRDAAKALGISESVLRHRLSAARQAMREKYEGLCTLVSKAGICHQCSGLRQFAPEAKRGGPLPDIADFADRLAVVREADFAGGRSQRLHDLFWQRTAEIEEKGIGATEVISDCAPDEEQG